MKSKLTRNRKYPLIRRELVRLYGEAMVRELTLLAEKHYADCEQLCRDASAGEWQHLRGTILPTAALYKALLELDPENALEAAHQVMLRLCQTGGSAMGKLLKLPGMQAAFMWLLPKLAVRLFGPACGFQFENYAASRRMLKMDMTACPYCRYAQRLGCPELMPVFCDSDFATYGDLPGIRFTRTQTLGTGGSCCDFRFTREQEA